MVHALIYDLQNKVLILGHAGSDVYSVVVAGARVAKLTLTIYIYYERPKRGGAAQPAMLI